MSDPDDKLLARLNALKPSSVVLNNSQESSIFDQSAQPPSVEDKLAARLKGLRSGAHTASYDTIQARQALDNTSSRPDGIHAHKNEDAKLSLADWQQNSDDDQALEDLLADLGPESQWKWDADEPNRIEALLKEAKDALPAESKQDATADAINNPNQLDESGNYSVTNDPGFGEFHSGENEKQNEEEETEDIMRRVMAEIELDGKYDKPEDEEVSPEVKDQRGSNFELPDAPSSLPQPKFHSEPPSYEDSELEARFSKLNFDLPSTPTSAPSSRTKAARKADLDTLDQAKVKSNLPTYTSEEIDSWCCICNEDGEVRCLGCDGDIYCQLCWSEGHGNGPGQERGHRAVQYNRPGPAAAPA